jgi:hypothetical protein
LGGEQDSTAATGWPARCTLTSDLKLSTRPSLGMFVDTETTDQIVADLQHTPMKLLMDINEIQGRVGLRTHLRATESIYRDWDSTQESAKEMKLWHLGMAAEHYMSQLPSRTC